VSPFDIAVGQNYAYYLVTAEAVSNRPEMQAFRTWLLDEAKNEEPCRPN
jgi:LysR family glycine cleavage system transcriptional activator